jgi:hypothetical protein
VVVQPEGRNPGGLSYHHRHQGRSSVLYTALMETDPLPSIVAAIARGRGRRGWKDPAAWVRFRAQLLSALALGHPLVWLKGGAGFTRRRDYSTHWRGL